MLLVIFGAGASYDSAPSGQSAEIAAMVQRPPLAKDLVSRGFDSLTTALPQARPIVDLLRTRMETDEAASLEVELARIAADAGTSSTRARQLVAFRFHLARLISQTIDTHWLNYTHGFTNYLRLLNHLLIWQEHQKKRVLLVTFNYDILLDQAASDMLTTWQLGSLDQFISRPDFRLFKLHGSTRWHRTYSRGEQIVGGRMINVAMDRAAEASGSGVIASGQTDIDELAKMGEYSLPALAIPLADKTDFECPPVHLEALRADLPEVDHVLVVGWRAAEPHAVELLGALGSGFSLGIVTKGEDGLAELRKNLDLVWRRGHLRFIEKNGFSAFTENAIVHLAALLDTPLYTQSNIQV